MHSRDLQLGKEDKARSIRVRCAPFIEEIASSNRRVEDDDRLGKDRKMDHVSCVKWFEHSASE